MEIQKVVTEINLHIANKCLLSDFQIVLLNE